MQVSTYVEGITAIRRGLKELGPGVKRSFDRRLRAIAREAAVDASAFAAWSKKIPPGITHGVTNQGAYIRYRGSAPTIGRLSELRTTWRHPLFGNREHWYAQKGRKFLRPAAEAKRVEVEREALEALDEVTKEVGL